jgi:hypothetical protein
MPLKEEMMFFVEFLAEITLKIPLAGQTTDLCSPARDISGLIK